MILVLKIILKYKIHFVKREENIICDEKKRMHENG